MEFGVQDGYECNAGLLARAYNWRGVMIECDPEAFGSLRARCAELDVRCINAYVTCENIAALFQAAGVPVDFDLLSIDIDGNDYWIWKAIDDWRPKVVVIEYNATLGPSASLTVRYDPAWLWSKTNRTFGASLTALWKLARAKGYSLIGTTTSGVNAFFIRDDIVELTGFPAREPAIAFHRLKGYFRFFPIDRSRLVEV